MALRRQKNNIINLALVIANEDEKAGMTIDQTILNGKSAQRVKTCSKRSLKFSLLMVTSSHRRPSGFTFYRTRL